jgi:hypothetical protein
MTVGGSRLMMVLMCSALACVCAPGWVAAAWFLSARLLRPIWR